MLYNYESEGLGEHCLVGEDCSRLMICLGGWSSIDEDLGSGVAASLRIGVTLPEPKFANGALLKKH